MVGRQKSGASCSNSIFCWHAPEDIEGGFIDEGNNQFLPDGCPVPCAGDLNADQVIGPADLGIMLAHWGTGSNPHPDIDLDGDGMIDAQDLGLLLGFWGPCQE